MSLIRELLDDLGLPVAIRDRLLAAHEEALDTQRTETARIRSEFDAFRQTTQAERTARQRQDVIRAALRRAGANEQAVDLLALAVSTTAEDWDGDALRDEAAALAPVRGQYAAFFATPAPLPTDPISPPLSGAGLTLADVRAMSADEINDNWSLIRAALAQRS